MKRPKPAKGIIEYSEFESVRKEYLAYNLSAEDALQKMFNILGIYKSVCRCDDKEWVDGPKGLHCSKCNKVKVKF